MPQVKTDEALKPNQVNQAKITVVTVFGTPPMSHTDKVKQMKEIWKKYLEGQEEKKDESDSNTIDC